MEKTLTIGNRLALDVLGDRKLEDHYISFS